MKKLLLAILIAIIAFLLFEWLTWPDVAALAKSHPDTTAFMEYRKRELRRDGKDDTLQHQWVSYEQISPYLRRAVLVSEDNAFYEHEGVDVKEVKEALRRDWKKKQFAYGGSTVTQQLAKNLWLSPSKNPLRKLKELLLTRSLENHLTKKRILEIYLNSVEFGERVYGAEAAARFYFHKSAAALSPNEAALLAGCLPNPRMMNPDKITKRLRARERIILARMRRWGYTVETEVLAEKKPEPESSTPEVTPTETTTTSAPETDTTVPETSTSEPSTTTETETAPTDTAPPPPSDTASTTTT
jgi:monofunctional biosynthetic peptidoglycan transglycosylase